MLEFQAHICWVITVDYKVRLGQAKSEFDWKRPKLTRSVRASKLPIFSIKYNSVRWKINNYSRHSREVFDDCNLDMNYYYCVFAFLYRVSRVCFLL